MMSKKKSCFCDGAKNNNEGTKKKRIRTKSKIKHTMASYNIYNIAIYIAISIFCICILLLICYVMFNILVNFLLFVIYCALLA